jgi:diguanylate cyclase (GGDEF)-like protein
VHGELMQAHASLEKKARIDGLTGGLNRETFLGLFETACAQPRQSALLLADADHFKRINDTFGHMGGDEALRSIAGAIAVNLRPLDFWGRVGGEEFAIFLDDVDESDAFYLAERLRKAVAGLQIGYDGAVIKTSVSIGIAMFEADDDAKRHYRAADRRLYRAKSAGRNQVVIRDEPDIETA